MHYVLFSGIVPASKAAVGTEYYSTLQPILQNISGIIEEVPFGDPTQPHERTLFARFTDAAAQARWRNHPTHLQITRDARQNVFDEFRLVVGTDDGDDAAAAARDAERRTVNIYQRPVTTVEPGEELKGLVDGVEKTAAGKTTESKFYVGEKLLMWVSRPKAGSNVEEFEGSLEWVPGDAVYRVRVVREYTKGDRKEALVGIDGAEAMAGARRMNGVSLGGLVTGRKDGSIDDRINGGSFLDSNVWRLRIYGEATMCTTHESLKFHPDLRE